MDFIDRLEAVDEDEVLSVCVRSHTGGRYWDELAISIDPKFELDSAGPFRLFEDHEHMFSENVRELDDFDDRFAAPEFIDFVKAWAVARLSGVKAGLEEIFREREAVSVSRAIIVTDEWLAALGDVTGETLPVSRFGFFWSAEDGSPDAYFPSDVEGTKIVIDGEVAPEAIDYRTTLLARMDYMNADDEGEIRLLPDAMITVRQITSYGPADAVRCAP